MVGLPVRITGGVKLMNNIPALPFVSFLKGLATNISFVARWQTVLAQLGLPAAKPYSSSEIRGVTEAETVTFPVSIAGRRVYPSAGIFLWALPKGNCGFGAGFLQFHRAS
jgi:hypothetical protein